MEYKKTKNCIYNINYHIVFCPKRRKSVFIGSIINDVDQKFREICDKYNITLEKISVMPDHIHLFINAPPTISIHKIVKNIKGGSSKYLRDRYPNLKKLPCLWSPSYYVGTVGFVSEDVVKKYIENQKSK